MSTDHPTDADIFAAHRYRQQDHSTIDGKAYCWCGWSTPIINSHKTAVDLWAAHVAEALTAARTIETVDELDALPIGTVVLTASPRYEDHEAFTRWSNKLWAAEGRARLYRTYDIVLPVTILHTPDSEDPA